MDESKQPLIGLNREQLGAELQSIGVAANQVKMRVNQLWKLALSTRNQ